MTGEASIHVPPLLGQDDLKNVIAGIAAPRWGRFATSGSMESSDDEP